MYEGTTLRNKTGSKAKVTIASIEARMIADCLESGQSQRQALEIVNHHCHENNQPPLSRSVATRLLNEMQPKICNIVRKKQRSRDPDSKWSQARLNWVKHLLIYFGQLPSKPPDATTDKILEWFDSTKVGQLELSQVVWWDETHKKCVIGDETHTNCTQYTKFKRWILSMASSATKILLT